MSDEINFEMVVEDPGVSSSLEFKSECLKTLLSVVKEMPLETAQEAKKAVEMANQARKFKNEAETKRKAILEPFQYRLKIVNRVSKEITEMLTAIEGSLKEKLTAWLDKNDPSCLKMTTEDGEMRRVKKWVFMVENPKSVPLDYCSVDEKKIKEAIDYGIRNIEGVRIYE